ncbi:MAG: sigma-70 family RNA polymerase sigma factor [Pseudomonadota bacterium]
MADEVTDVFTEDQQLQLIENAKAGSVEAFNELLAGYRERLLRFLVTRSASFADAEDALQDTMINAFRYLHTYNARWRFSTWLYRIAINNAARLRRTESVELGDLRDEEGDPLRQCIETSERENLWLVARRELSDEVFTAMWLRYVEDQSVKDIAALLDRSVSWAKINLMRGRNALDAALTKHASANGGQACG